MRPPHVACEVSVVIKCTQANYNNWDISISLMETTFQDLKFFLFHIISTIVKREC